MSDPTIDWRENSRSFDAVAGLYDRYRPSYPETLIDEILSTTGIPEDGRILEIGSGTGKATTLFARRGYPMLCIEPGKHLAQIAGRKLKAFPSIEFQITTFEDWEADDNLFDLVISAQAFHWVAKEIRYSKTAQVLMPTGSLALFWNRSPLPDAPIYQKLQQVYQRDTPELASSAKPDYEKDIQYWVDELNESGYFTNVKVKRCLWKKTYNTQQYLGLLNTYSDHLRLSEEKRQHLFMGIKEVLEEEGGKIEKLYEAVAYIARQRA